MTGLLEIDDAAVNFGGVQALDGASLSIAAGSLCGLIGPNGSGKSTLLSAISRLIRLASGRLLLDGEEYTRAAAHAASALGISRTFQTVRLLHSMPVLANVMVGASTAAVRDGPVVNWLFVPRSLARNRAARRTAETALERVGMREHARAYAQDLPYGHQRHVEIARALASAPRILLLDEPTAGMSHAERERVGDLMLELRDDGLTQVLVEHDLAMIHRLCDHAFALNFGRVIASGTPREVSRDAAVREAYLGSGHAGAQSGDPIGAGSE